MTEQEYIDICNDLRNKAIADYLVWTNNLPDDLLYKDYVKQNQQWWIDWNKANPMPPQPEE